MRWFVVFLLALVALHAVDASSLTRTLPAEHPADTPLTVVLQVSDGTVGQRVIVSELLPEGAALGTWSIDGAQESADALDVLHEGQSYVWEFTAQRSDPSITYEVLLPGEGATTFDAVYITSPTDFGRLTGSVRLVPKAVPASPETPAPIAEPAPEPLGLSAPIFALYCVLLAAFGYLMWRIRQHAPRKSSQRRLSFLLRLRSWIDERFVAVGRGGTTFATAVEHVAHAPVVAHSAHTPVHHAHTPVHASSVVHAASASHTVVNHHVPVQEPRREEHKTPTLDRADQRYERVLKRIEEYERLAKDDDAVIELLEALKAELRSISFEYHETRGKFPATA